MFVHEKMGQGGPRFSKPKVRLNFSTSGRFDAPFPISYLFYFISYVPSVIISRATRVGAAYLRPYLESQFVKGAVSLRTAVARVGGMEGAVRAV